MESPRNLFRKSLFASCVALGKLMPPRGVPILLYHSIDTSGSPISVSPQNFAWQMGWLAKNGWFTMTLDELLQLMKANRMPKKRVVITFDDGFRNNLTEALPALSAFGFTATVFVATETVGRTNSFVTSRMPQFPMLGWEDLRKLAEAGWQIESHGHTHTNLPQLDYSELCWELQISRDWLQKQTGVYANHFCYPRGKFNETVLHAVQDAQYKSACSLRVGLVKTTSNPWTLERLAINDRVTPMHFKALLSEPYSQFAALRRSVLGKY